jgi:chemotaxis protein MotB
MARKKKHPEHENHERWLISYADFITLLFAFFVVMFASSQADKKKAQQVSESVKTALEKGAQASSKEYVPRGREDPKGKGGSDPGKDKDTDKAREKEKEKAEAKAESAAAAAAELMPSMKFLSQALSHEIETGKIEVHMEVRGLVVSLHEGAFFASGDDKIVPASYPSVAKIADIVRGLKNPVRLEGHTDAIPIHTERFQSNWELSASRSISMLNLLTSRFSIPRNRFGIAGYADTMPVDSNDTATGRARNRRVDIVILNDQAAADTKPAPGPEPAARAPAADAKVAPVPSPATSNPKAVQVSKPSPISGPKPLQAAKK